MFIYRVSTWEGQVIQEIDYEIHNFLVFRPLSNLLMVMHGHRFGLWTWPLETSHYARLRAPVPIMYWLI